jgi:aspartyl-tRNA(Asn)/glutamyl-tRNA(Gln) amidotransferase subunit A
MFFDFSTLQNIQWRNMFLSTTTSTSDLTLMSVHAHQEGLLAGRFSVMELVKAFLERIDKFNPELNAFITTVGEQATQKAIAIDNEIRQGKQLEPMAGIPYALKDLFCTKGILTSCASKILSNFTSPYDATIAEKLNQAKAILLGKANMDEFAMGSSNENSFYGLVRNPWDRTRVPGGSSGGSAAIVAARLAPAAFGTDTGGSIRQPASFTGVTGLKPTYGRVSRYGMIAFASSLDQCGPLAHSAQDAAILLNVVAGFDERDSTSANHPVTDYTTTLDRSIEGLKIGLPKEYFSEGLDQAVAQAVEEAIKAYQKLGATIHEISLSNTHFSIPVYYVIAPAECSSNLARFDGVRFGYRCENPENLEDLYKRTRGEGFGDEVKRRIMVGTYALSAGYYDAYYLQAQKVRRLIKEDFLKAFEQVDVIMGPTSPTVAFKIGEKIDDPVAMYQSDVYTIPSSLAGLPAISIPAGFVNDLPVGLQIIGSYFQEEQLLNVAHKYQEVTDWHLKVPEDFESQA